MMPESTSHGVHIGRLDGRLQALEARMDRNEDAVWGKLDAIEAKLDSVLKSAAMREGWDHRAKESRGSTWVALAAIGGLISGAGSWLTAIFRLFPEAPPPH